jgi:hypothetical protein
MQTDLDIPAPATRYCFLTPAIAQHSVIIPFDQGDREACKPVTFRMKPAFITRMGAKRNHTPGPEQLKGTGLKVAEEQPHIPSEREGALVENWKPQSPMGTGGALIAPAEDSNSEPTPIEPEPKPKQKRQPRMPRARISATKLDGSVPVTLGGKLPPVSVLARREFGLRALRR